jgi:Flp pilus assembly protein TadG
MGRARTTQSARDERGAAIVEAAIVVPLVLLIVTGIFDLGRAYQTYQVLSNAAREGARAAVVPAGDATKARQVVESYMKSGSVPAPKGQQPVDIQVDRQATITLANGDTVGASQVTIRYPYEFMVLGPVAKLVASNSTAGDAFTMEVSSVMRNESQ